MIQRASSLLALSGLLCLAACSREEVEAKMNEVASATGASIEAIQRELEELDLSAAPEALKAKVGAAVESLAATLGEIKDQATAENVQRALEPVVAKLDEAKVALGEKLPSREELLAELEALEAEFADNEAVMKVLRPLIDKLQELAQ